MPQHHSKRPLTISVGWPETLAHALHGNAIDRVATRPQRGSVLPLALRPSPAGPIVLLADDASDLAFAEAVRLRATQPEQAFPAPFEARLALVDALEFHIMNDLAGGAFAETLARGPALIVY